VSDIQRLDNGNTVATRTNGSVIEVNREGKNVWQVSGLSTPYRVHRLRNGNTLVTEYSANRVVEFDRAKKIVWKLENLKSPDSAQRLPNGQTLVTDANGVHVYNSDGKRVWHFGATRSVAVRY
jgi:hypothetical protein